MGNRTRKYRRNQRQYIIEKKKKKCIDYYGRASIHLHADEGRLNKGKIFCSCCLCRDSDCRQRHILTKQEIIAITNMKEGLDEYKFSE